jgi:cell division protein FtsW
MVLSASYIHSLERFGDGTLFFRRQIIACGLGLGVTLLAAFLRPSVYKRIAVPLLLLTILSLVLVLIPTIGAARGGARRWLAFGPVTFQPGEIAKIALVLYLARFVAKRQGEMESFTRGVLPPLTVGGLLMFLVAREPDLGTAFLLALILFVMLFVGSARMLHLGGIILVSLVPGIYAIQAAGYRLKRITSYLNPWADPLASGFQIIQSYLAFGSGGLWGQGLGSGGQKLLYLPEAHTDFIFSVVAEELGLLGSMVVLGLFVVLITRGLRLAFRASDPFDSLLVFGVTSLLGLQVALNLAVVMGLLPTKGLPLPLVSYGGSSVVTSLFMIGILINRSRAMGRGG